MKERQVVVERWEVWEMDNQTIKANFFRMPKRSSKSRAFLLRQLTAQIAVEDRSTLQLCNFADN
jgi:hypothetical protein